MWIIEEIQKNIRETLLKYIRSKLEVKYALKLVKIFIYFFNNLTNIMLSNLLFFSSFSHFYPIARTIMKN